MFMICPPPPTRERIVALVNIADETATEYPGSFRDTQRFTGIQERLFSSH